MTFRRLLLLALMLTLVGVAGHGASQVMPGSGIVRHYNFEQSGIDYYPAGNPPDLEITFNQSPASDPLIPDRGAYSFVKHGAAGQSDDSTFPAGPSGARGKTFFFGGTNEWYECSEAAGCSDFDTPTNLTVCWDARPGSFGSTRYIASKYEASAGDLRAWSVAYIAGGAIYFTISKDGQSGAGHQTQLNLGATSWVPFSRGVGCATYKYVADGTSEMRGYMNGMTTVSSNIAVGPVFDNGEAVAIGSTSRGASLMPGWFSHLAIWSSEAGDASKTLTEAECRRWIAGRWGTYNGTTEGMTVVNPTGNYEQILPYTSGSNYIQAMPPNSAAVINPTGNLLGIEGDPPQVQRAWRWGAEAWSGAAADGCTNYPTGWVPACNAGDGTADMAPVLSNVPEGGYAIGMTLTGTTSLVVAAQHCDTDGVGATLDLAVEHRCASGTCSSIIQVYQYSDPGCTVGGLPTITPVTIGAGSSTWMTRRGRIVAGTWDVTAQSYRVRLTEVCDGGCSSHWDALMAQNSATGITPTYARCGSNADSDVICNFTYVSDHNPLRGNMAWTIDWRGFSEWSDADNGIGSWFYGTARIFSGYAASDYGLHYMLDEDGDSYIVHTVVGLAWAADTVHTFRFSRNGFGKGLGTNNILKLDATYFNATSGSTGDGLGTWEEPFYLVGRGATSDKSSNCVLSDLLFRNRMVPE